jgi:hypothetical protein
VIGGTDRLTAADSTTSVARPLKATLVHPLVVRLPVTRAARAAFDAACQRPIRHRRRRTRAMLRLRGVPIPTTVESPVARVFVNHPAIHPKVPISDPHYVGTVAFFGSHAEHVHSHGDGVSRGRHRASFALDLTPTLERLHHLGETIGHSVTVQIVPVLLSGCVSECDLQIGAIDLVTLGA